MSYSLGAVRLKLKVLAGKSGGQSNLALMTGISRQFVNDVIHGRRKPTNRILKALGLRRIEIYVSRQAALGRGEAGEGKG